MTEDPRVQQLLDELLGSQATPEEVCATCPELLPVVRSRWRQVRRLRADLDALFPPPDVPSTMRDTLSPPPSAPTPQPPEGTALPRIPGYEVLQELGRGGMGVVYKALHLRLNRPVALKMLLGGDHAGPRERARFQREAEAVAGLRHENVVRVHDVGDHEGRPYFTMEYVEGGSLAQHLAGTPQAARPAAALVATLAGAVQAAHACGVAHRDLKPANVLLTADGTPKVSDFGLARRLEGGAGLTQSGVLVGTPSYMAPEQARGQAQAIGPAVDVYALGAILYELLTGRPPFSGETAAATVQQVLTQDPVPPSRLNHSVPRDLETVCLKCLHKEPGRRYTSALALADDLRRFGEGRPIQARPVGWGARCWRWCRRNPTAAALLATALVLVGLASGGGVWLVQQRAERRAEAARHDAELRNDVGTAVAQAVSLRKAFHFHEARELLEQARQRLGPAGPDDLRRRVEQGRADLDLAERLDAARARAASVVEGKFDPAGAEPLYVSAFAAAGLSPEGDDSEAVAAAVRESAVRAEIVAALDDWASITPDLRRRAGLLAVARGADPDPARDRLRQPELWQDGARLTRLLQEASVAELTPQLATALGRVARARGGDAVALLTAAQSRFPQDFWLNFELSFALHRAHRPEEALGYSRVALALRPNTSEACNQFGFILQANGRLDEAIDHFQQAVRLGPRYDAAHHNLACALQAKGRVDEAIRHFEEALRIDPKFALAHIGLGESLQAKGRLDEAIGHYEEALRIDPQNALAHNNLGLALNKKGKVEEAVGHYEQALRIDPKLAGAHTNLGSALRAKGRLDEAIGHLEQAVRLGPKHAVARANLGSALQAKGRLDEAIGHLEQAVRLGPKHAVVRANLGSALQAKGRLEEAIGHYQQALRIDPKHTVARINLAGLLRDKGRVDEAIDHLQQAVRLDPRNAVPQAALCSTLYDAARAAAQAAAGQGPEKGRLAEPQRAGQRRQALGWLRASLEVATKLVRDGKVAAGSLSAWQTDPALAGVRDPAELAKLPDAEREQWQRLWADVAALIAADGKRGAPQK
jgi:serine/threonine-protein kinase